jgi:hypothetical protein
MKRATLKPPVQPFIFILAGERSKRGQFTPEDIAKRIAKEAQENLEGLDVVSVGPMRTGESGLIELYAVVPKNGRATSSRTRCDAVYRGLPRNP